MLLRKLLYKLSIRDTVAHDSVVSACRDVTSKVIVVENSLDMEASLQFEGSLRSDFAKVIKIGSPFKVGAGVNDYQTSEIALPYVRIKVTCAVAPTQGVISVYIIKVKG